MSKNYHLAEKNKKTVVRSFRFTPEVNDKIIEKAKSKKVTDTELVQSYIEFGLKSRQPRGAKQIACSLVEVQEAYNQLLLNQEIDEDVKKELKRISKEAMNVWEF